MSALLPECARRARFPLLLTAVLTLGTAPIAFAGSSPAVSPDIQAIARQLATMATESAGSCSVQEASSLARPLAFNRMTAALEADAGSGVQVMCALPYTNGKPGADCTGKHTMLIQATAGAKVVAELMGLDTNGVPLGSFLVNNGDRVHMASRLSPTDWKFTNGNKEYSIFAPVPLLKVTAELNGETAVAYCSNIPWLDVVQPNGGVVTEESGGAVKVVAAVPRTDPNQLQLIVDGENVLDGVNPNLCTAATPCAFTSAGGKQVDDLIVDIAPTINVLSSNTVRATINGLECGGHTVRVTSARAPGSLKNPTSAACNIDDLRDQSTASIFGIRIDSPVPDSITEAIPTPVLGEICGGTQIVEANINGKPLDVTQQQVQNGPFGDKVTLAINTLLDRTNLRQDFDAQTNALGTFAAGSNRLLAEAREVLGTRVYERFIFATAGDQTKIKSLALADGGTVINQALLEAQVNSQLKATVEAKLQQALMATGETEINNAFVLGITGEGAQTLFNKLCTAPLPGDGRTLGQIFKNAVETELGKINSGNPLTEFSFSPICGCTVDVDIFVGGVTAGTDFACPLTFEDGKIKVSLELPDVDVTLRAVAPDNGCAVPVPFPPFVLPNTSHVDATATVGLRDIHFDYTLTEADILGSTTTVGAEPFKIDGQVELGISGGLENTIAGDICAGFIDVFVTVLTFGTVDIGPLLYLQLDITEEIDLTEALAPAKPDAIPLKGIGVEEQVVDPFHQQLSGIVSEVHIRGPIAPNTLEGAGITAGLKGKFATTKIDALVESNPGFEALEPPVPDIRSMVQQGAKSALVGLSQDSINMMFASLAGAGDMKLPTSDEQGCFPTGATVGSLLPPDCNSLDFGVGQELVTAGARGYCHAIRQANCDVLSYPDPDPTGVDFTALLTGTVRGVCHGAKGDPCSQVSPEGDLVEIGLCLATPNFNLRQDQNLMFCAKADIPTMAFPDTNQVGNVPTELHLNDLSVSLVIDRGANAVVDGSLGALPGCFSGTQTASDCSVFSACLDINLDFTMSNVVCEGNKPGFQAGFQGIKILNREVGVVCSGQSSPTSDGDVLDQASDDQSIVEPLAINAGVLFPPICGAGLDMGGFVQCNQSTVLALEAGVQPDFREFLAITCQLE